MAESIRGVIDMDAVRKAIAEGEGTSGAIKRAVDEIARRANSMSSGYRTGFYHRKHMSPAVGGTQPKYKGNVKKRGKWPVGIVYTANYAAQKENMEHNTLLKSI